jgi:transcription initiation factor IIE alpha subunit
MNYGFKKRLDNLRDSVAYVCPICEKPTGFNEAEVRYPKGINAMEKISEGNYRWQCKHCQAWHRHNHETPIKP